MLKIVCHRGMSGLWILGRPNNVQIVGWCSMRDVQVFWIFMIFLESIFLEVMFLLMVVCLDISLVFRSSRKEFILSTYFSLCMITTPPLLSVGEKMMVGFRVRSDSAFRGVMIRLVVR